MAFTLIQAGTALQLVDPSGNIATVTLPTAVTLSTTRTPRFAIFNRYVVMVNSPNRPITVDGFGIARVLCPRPPGTIPVTSAQAGGTLSGTGYKVKQTFRIKDAVGNIIAESDFGPLSNATTVAAQWLRVAGLDLSPDTVTSSMLYRNLTAGSVYFPWVELDGNTQTQIQDDLSDASLSLVAAPTFGTPPDLTLIAEYKGRLWGVDRNEIDDLRYTEAGKMYAWPVSRLIPIPKVGADRRGVTALGSTRDALMVGRINNLHQITGSSSANFSPVKITENCGILSQESVAVFNNAIYFLWYDGVYRWDSSGLVCISDGQGGKGRVRSWFTTDSYFNRARFNVAVGQIDPTEKKYKLFLSAAGSTDLDRWVEFDIMDGTWWGPHKTGAFTPTSALIIPDTNENLTPVIASSNGFLWEEQATRTDDTATAVDFDVNTKRHDGQTPDIDKLWGLTSIMGPAQTTGQLTITPSVGELNAAASTRTLFWDMRLNRQMVGRPGTGKHLKLNFRENTVGQDVRITGYEVEFHELGRR
jgi:hypothetical protein